MKTQRRLLQFCWFGGFALVVLTATGASWLFHFTPPVTAVKPAPAAAQALQPVWFGFGHVDAERGVTRLAPAIPGRVTAVEANDNDHVPAGGVLLRLDDRVPRLLVRQAEAACEAARLRVQETEKLPAQYRVKRIQQGAAIEAVRHRIAAAGELLEQKKELVRDKLANAKEVSAAESHIEELRAMLRAEEGKLSELDLADPQVEINRARADLAARESQLDQARRGQEECVLKAPVAGTVLRVLVGPGDLLGTQLNPVAVEFCPDGKRIIRTEVEQEYAREVKVGQTVRVQDDTRDDATWSGMVTHISGWYAHRRSMLQEPLQFNDVRTVEVLVTLDPGQTELRIGQRVRVQGLASR
jgi:multidrug resistance efflux pump